MSDLSDTRPLPLLSRLSRVYYGWWIVVIAFIGNALEEGVYHLGFSVFFLPISREFDISRAEASLPLSLARAVSIFTILLLGIGTDRIGPARVFFIGGLLGGLGFVLLNWVPSYTVFLVVFVAVLTPGMQNGLSTPTTVASSYWFDRRRSLVLVIGSIGFAIGGAVLTPLVSLLVQNFGWQVAALVVGITIWAVAFPMSIFLRNPSGPAELGKEAATRTTPGEGAANFTVRESLRTIAYWILAFSYAFRSTVWAAIAFHFVAILVWKGIEESTAGLLLGSYTLFWILSSLVMGWLGDRYSKERLSAIGGLLGAVAMVMFLVWDTFEPWHVLFVFFLLGPNEGSWPLGSAIMVEQFGPKVFGSLRGGMFALSSFLSIGAPFYSGWVFDTTDSYVWVVAPAAVLLAVAGLLNWFMPQATPRVHKPPGGKPSEALTEVS